MGEKQPVTQGEDLTVTVQDVEDSEWGLLTYKRQKLYPTERRDTILSTFIQQAKNDLLLRTDRTWAAFTGDSQLKIDATETILMMVGVKILRRAQAGRVDITEADYNRQIILLEEKIDKKIMNLEVQSSPITVSNVEPDMVDPDADYDYT